MDLEAGKVPIGEKLSTGLKQERKANTAGMKIYALGFMGHCAWEAASKCTLAQLLNPFSAARGRREINA